MRKDKVPDDGEKLGYGATYDQESEESRLKLEALNTGNIILLNSPGMRIIKTCLAVLLCLIIEYFRMPNSLYDSSIAAVVCLRTTNQDTKRTGIARVIGTLLAGVYSIIVIVLLTSVIGIGPNSLPYYILIALFVLPLMQGLVKLGLPDAVSIATIVYLIVCISTTTIGDALSYVPARVMNTIVGILVSIFINWLPILNKLGRKYDEGRQKAIVNVDDVKDRLEKVRIREAELEIKKDIERQKIEDQYAEEIENWKNSNRF